MIDRFKQSSSGSTGAATHGFAITPDDTQNLSEIVRAIYIGGAGTITLVSFEGDALTFTNVLAGTILPIRAIAVKSTGTDASDLVGLV